MAAKTTTINEVAKDRLWRDYVSREEGHQNYWAIESQFVKGSLSPEKRNIMRSNVETTGDFDANTLLGTSRGDANAESLASTSKSLGSSRRPINTINMSNNPDAPSNLLLRQLQMTAAENTQTEAKQLEVLQNYKNVYSTRAANQARNDSGRRDLPPMAPSPTHNAPAGSPLRPSNVQKEPTLNNSYCSYYAGKDIGIHHYHYSPPSNRCQGLSSDDGSMSASASPSATMSGTVVQYCSGARLANLPPLNTGLLQSVASRGGCSVSGSPTRSNGDNCFNSSRVYAEELEAHASIVSPKRHYTETGLLHPGMGKRVASATGRRGYGQRIASTTNETHCVRPSVELKERSAHGYRKW